MTLENKVIVVIGGTSGLGLSAAKAFTLAGAKVVALGRDPKKVEIANQQLGRSGIAMAADATDPKAAPAAIQVAKGNFGRIDGLYHVAGGSGRSKGDGPLHELTDEGLSYTLDLNLKSVIYSNRAAVRTFIEQKTGGSILNMSSVLAYSPSPAYFATHAYAAAKAAIIGLTKSAAAYYAHAGIRCNVIAPALVATPMSERAQNNDHILDFIATKQPLDGGRIGRPEDLDAAAVYFMSDASKFATGQLLAVDGGWSVTEGQIASMPQPSDSPTQGPPQKQLIHKLARWWVNLQKD